MSIKNSSIYLASEGNFDTVSTDSLTEMRSLVAEYAEDPNGAVLDGWEPREGTIITEVRAISARINQNYDAWPSEELREAHHTFIGKPVFVNHMNHDPDRARGRVVASRYVDAGEHDRYIQVLQEVEATRFPMLAKELMEGGLDSVSMGAEAREVECSYCANISTSPFDACEHIPLKGSYLQRRTASGTPEDILVYEICRKISFFELSYVFDPADETAVASNVLVANRHGLNSVEVPPKVDTLHPDEDEKSQDDWQEFVDDPNVIDTIDVLDEPDLGLNQELDRVDDELPEGFEEFADVDDRIEENEQAEKELAQDAREKSQEKADEKAEKAQQQFEQSEPDPEDDDNWEDEDDGAGGTSSRFKGGGIEALVADDYGTFNMWVEKNGSLIASDSYTSLQEAKEAAISVAKQHRAEWAGYRDFEDCKQQNSNADDPDAYCGEIKNRADKESKMSRTARRKVAQAGQFQEVDGFSEGLGKSKVWVYWPMFASGKGLVVDEDAEGHTFYYIIQDGSGRYVKSEFANSVQEAMQAVDDYYHGVTARKHHRRGTITDRKSKESKMTRATRRRTANAPQVYKDFLQYAKGQGIDLAAVEDDYFSGDPMREESDLVFEFEQAMSDFANGDDDVFYTLLEAPGSYEITHPSLNVASYRSASVDEFRSWVEGSGIPTRNVNKEGGGFSFSSHAGQVKVYSTNDGSVAVQVGNGAPVTFPKGQKQKIRKEISRFEPAKLFANRKQADDYFDAPGVDMSQTMLDGMGGYGDAVAVAFDSNGNAIDLALNWETAQSMANEGYNMQVLRGDGGKSQDEIQRMVDYEKELVRDLYGSRHKHAIDYTTGDMCIDCLMILANDDDSGMSDEQAAESRAGIASLRAEGIEPVPGDFVDPSFGSYPCEVCGTRLAGDRVPVNFLEGRSASRNGGRRISRTNNRATSRRSNRMAPQRRRRIGDNKQTPLLEDTGIAQTPAEEPAVDVETGGDAPNNSESDRVKSARRALAREMARERAIQARRRKQAYNGWSNWDTWNASLWLNNDQGLYNEALGKSASELRALVEDFGVTGDGFDVNAVNWDEVAEGFNDEAHYARRRPARRRQAAPVGADLSGANVNREDLFENYPATKMTASRVRNRFAAWAKENYGASLRQASGPGELRSWARAFAKESGIELQSLHTAIKRDIVALRTAEDKDDMPDFIKEKVESDDDNPSKKDVEDADDKKESARRRAAARRAAMQARRGRGRTKTTRRRTADDKLDLAAPDDRVNVEKPTSGTTDADAEASQFDKADFDNNSGKGLENPDTTPTAGTPGGPSVNDLKRSSRATGLQAVRLAEAMITAGLIEDSTEAKFKAAAQFEKMSRDIVLDRTALLEKVATVHAKRPSTTKSAGNRGTSLNSAVPPNMSGMTRSSAPQTREAASANDSDLFF